MENRTYRAYGLWHRRSEARMMADLALAQGASTNDIRLEEKARTTSDNARLTARLIRKIKPDRILIVTKSDHLDWAMPIFRKIDVFKSAEGLPCKVDREASIAQMQAYFKDHPDNHRVRDRLAALQRGVQGTD